MFILAAINPNILIVGAVVLTMLCAGLAAWALMSRREAPEDQISRRLSSIGGNSGSGSEGASSLDLLKARRRGSLASRLSVLAKPIDIKSDYDRNKLALRLAQGGFRNQAAVSYFLSAKMLMLIGGATLGFVVAYSRSMDTANLFSITTILGILGFMAPNIWLSMRASSRTENITNALPDSLDMLVIAVEAGLGLDAAIQRVGEEMARTYPELAVEWQIAARETQMGIPRAEAMTKMAERTNVSEMRALVAILTQAERFGTSIAQTLRVHADTVRVKRRQRAEERAAKTTVKLLFPLVFFLFPVIFIVIMGPPVINILKSGLFNR